MDLKQLSSAIDQIVEEKSISREMVLETLETALAAAYKKDYGDRDQHFRVQFDPETGAMKVFQVFLVVTEDMLESEEEIQRKRELRQGQEAADQTGQPAQERGPLGSEESAGDADEEEKKIRFSPQRHKMLDEAAATNPDVQSGEEVLIEVEPPTDFGRIAAQTAKQVIIQRLREAERDAIYEEFKGKEDDVVSGVVQRMEGGTVFVDIGKTIGVIYPDEQLPTERYRIGERFRVYVLRVERGARGPSIVLSRVHPKLVSKLFAIEVPEISAGTVEVKAVAREAGSRSKIAVSTDEDGVDPVGSCIGQKGTRVQTVIHELGGEKVDIIQWDPDISQFIANALSPARVLYVDLNAAAHSATAVVPPDQVSLAIGQRGQNVRLAAKLAGWRIDIKSEEEMKAVAEQRKRELRGEDEVPPAESEGPALEDLPGVGAKTAESLRSAGFHSIEAVASSTAEALTDVEGIGPATARKIQEAARAMTGAETAPAVSEEVVQESLPEGAAAEGPLQSSREESSDREEDGGAKTEEVAE